MSIDSREHLIGAFRRILRPLIAIMIRAGVRFDEFCSVVRGVYVESAIRDGIGIPGDVTRSRVSVVTGIGRRDVDKFVDDESLLANPRKTTLAVLTEVLHRWNTDQRYLGPYGVPLEIDFDVTPHRCFRDIVRETEPRVDAGEILEELLRAGVVTRSGEQHYKVVARTFVAPEPMSPVMLEHFSKSLTNLARTLDFNLNPKNQNKRLERAVFADHGLPASQLEEFEAYARAKVQDLIVDIDNWFANTQPGRSRPDQRFFDVGLNIFQYVSERTPDPSLKSIVDKGLTD